MSDELKIARIQEGKTAMFVMRHLEPMLNQRIKYALGELKQHFASGTLTESKAQALTAKLVSYDEIISALTAQINIATAESSNPDIFINTGEIQNG